MNNDENIPQAPPVDNVMQPMAPNPAPVPTQTPVVVPTPLQKQPRSRMKIAMMAVFGVIMVLLIIGAYYLGTLAPKAEVANNTATKTDTAVESTELSKKTADADTIPVADSYDGWQEYTNPTYGYSFKHPADWQISRKVIQAPYDWVSVTLPGEKNPGSHDIIAFYSYLDGTGCGQIKEKQFIIGNEPATGTADCGDTRYTVMTKNSDDKRVALRIDTARGNDTTVAQLLKSVVGLTVIHN